MRQTFLEGTKPPREGEGLDLARVGPWLREVLGVPEGAELRVGQFPGGHSNLTYAVSCGDREVVVRRPPLGAVAKSAHDMGREWRVLRALAPRLPLAPRPIAYSDDEARLGSKVLVMERVPGLIVRREWPREVALNEERARALCEAFVDALVRLHAVDWQGAGLSDFGKPEGFVGRQVVGWTERYRRAETHPIEDMDTIAAWFPSHVPPLAVDGAVVHNDFKLDNLVLDPEHPATIRAVLDWEMAALGDPFMDVGTALSYWVEAGDDPRLHAFRFGPTHEPGMMTRAELVRAYAEGSGRTTEHIVFYAAFGLFKTAVVAQQIFARYARGQTQDARFAAFLEGVRVLARRAAHTIERGEV
jgi:aminoglycoside phosphotransferase (APT) family kinase protein